MNERDAERFWEKVDKSGDCWEWQGSRSHKGYGRFRLNGKARWAHRVAWRLTHGSVPADLDVMHRCDNPPCVRPDHLAVGTRRDNMLDMARKGRAPLQQNPALIRRGEQAYNHKLTADDVRTIRAAVQAGASKRGQAQLYGVSRRLIQAVISRQSWAHVA